MCESCEALNINGVNCHEAGCPDSWRDYDVECLKCGSDFRPAEGHQKFCDDECASAYYGA